MTFRSESAPPSNERCTSKCGACKIYDHDSTVTELKYIWNIYVNYEKLKKTGSLEIYKTVCHNGSYVLLFGKGNLLNFKILYQ